MGNGLEKDQCRPREGGEERGGGGGGRYLEHDTTLDMHWQRQLSIFMRLPEGERGLLHKEALNLCLENGQQNQEITKTDFDFPGLLLCYEYWLKMTLLRSFIFSTGTGDYPEKGDKVRSRLLGPWCPCI